MSDENATDEKPEYTWEQIRFLLTLGGRPNLALAVDNARNHLVWFARRNGVRAGKGEDRHWGLRSAIRTLCQKGLITAKQQNELLVAIETRDDKIHVNQRSSDDELRQAVLVIASVCDVGHTETPQEPLRPIERLPELAESKPLLTESDYVAETERKFYEAKSRLDSMQLFDDPIAWGKQKLLVVQLANAADAARYPEKHAQEQRERRKKNEEAAQLRQQEREREDALRRAKKEQEEETRIAVEVQTAETDRRRRTRDIRIGLLILVLTLVVLVVSISLKRMIIRHSSEAESKRTRHLALRDGGTADASETVIRRDAGHATQQTGPLPRQPRQRNRAEGHPQRDASEEFYRILEMAQKHSTAEELAETEGRGGPNFWRLCALVASKRDALSSVERERLDEDCGDALNDE